MESNKLMFILFGAIIIIFSTLTVTSRRILRAAVYLLFVLISTSGLYFMLNYQFLAAVQLTLYAGGIVVLIIFSILLTSHIDEKMETINWKKGLFSALASFLGAVLCITTFLQYKFNASGIAAKELSISEVGRKLLGYGEDGYALPFELISVLLLAAMVAAIVIAKKEKSS